MVDTGSNQSNHEVSVLWSHNVDQCPDHLLVDGLRRNHRKYINDVGLLFDSVYDSVLHIVMDMRNEVKTQWTSVSFFEQGPL